MNRGLMMGIGLIFKRTLCLTALAGLFLAPEVFGTPVASRLDRPVFTNGNVQLTLTSEVGVEYTISSSPDLKTWTPLITNSDPQIYRTFEFGPTTNIGFFRATRARLPVFSAALMATGMIDLNGMTFQTDSFDSADTNYSDNGSYPFAYLDRQKDNGHVMTDASVTNSLGVGTQRIKGRVRTGPDGAFALGFESSVGSKLWVEGNNGGVQPGYLSNDMSVIFPAPKLPTNTWYSPPSGTVNGVSYSAILSAGNWWLSSFNKVLVTGDAKVYVPNSFNMTSTNVIRLNTNASLKIYMGGASAKFGGAGIDNPNQNASSFSYFGLASNTNVDFAGNANITGTIYAPTAGFTLGGGSSDTYHFIGASVSKSVKLNGHFYFHFDENLMRVGPTR